MAAGRRSFLRWTLGGVAGLAVADASMLGAATTAADDPWLTLIAAAVGMHARGLAHLVSQAAWDDLGLMEWLAPQLNGAEAAALKAGAGTFAAASAASAASVVELRARGVRFLACRETIAKWAQRVATQKGETPAVVSERIVRGLHEGVEPVPAMIAAAVLAEARGCGYVALA